MPPRRHALIRDIPEGMLSQFRLAPRTPSAHPRHSLTSAFPLSGARASRHSTHRQGDLPTSDAALVPLPVSPSSLSDSFSEESNFEDEEEPPPNSALPAAGATITAIGTTHSQESVQFPPVISTMLSTVENMLLHARTLAGHIRRDLRGCGAVFVSCYIDNTFDAERWNEYTSVLQSSIRSLGLLVGSAMAPLMQDILFYPIMNAGNRGTTFAPPNSPDEPFRARLGAVARGRADIVRQHQEFRVPGMEEMLADDTIFDFIRRR